MGVVRLKTEIYHILKQPDFFTRFTDLLDKTPAAKLLKPLISGICHSDEDIHWHAVTCVGEAVRRMAEEELESARVVMRRFMWSLNDESGGIGWGAPEAMAECLARHHRLAEEYSHILVSFMREDGFFLEYEPLQAGLMWGLWRLAAVEPELLRQKNAASYQAPYLGSPHPEVRGLAAISLGRLGADEYRRRISALLTDQTPLRLYHDHKISPATVARLATMALDDLS